MRLTWACPLMAVMATLIGSEVRASYCGANAYPASCCTSEQCDLPAVRYRICYRTGGSCNILSTCNRSKNAIPQRTLILET